MNSITRRLRATTLLLRLGTRSAFEFCIGKNAVFARNLVLTIAGVLMLVLSASLRLRAQCNSGYLNYGDRTAVVCTYNSPACSGDVCESDTCNWFPCGVSGSGWITYCAAECGQTDGCLTCPY